MSRNKGTFNFSANFEPLLKAPLDARQVVGTFADLTDPSTWKDADELVWLYNGLIVGVGNDADPSLNGAYFLKDADNYTNALSWSKLGGGTVIDVSALMAYIDGSIARLDASINQLWTYVDGSITQLWDYLDSSFGGQFVKESSLGPSFYWDASGLLDVSVSGSSFSGDVSTSHVFYDPALDPSLAMPNTVGGIPAGTTVYDLQGDSLRSILNDLLFPTQNPVLTGPSAIIAVSPTTLLYEVSANVNLTFTSTLNRGSINPQYSADSPYRSGLPNNFNFTGFGLVDMSSNSIPYISPAFDMSIGLTQSWSVAISYDGGVQPFNNKGVIYDSSLAPGTVSSNTITISGSYPYFATTSNIATLTKQTLVALSTNPAPSSSGMLLVAESGGNKQKFEIPNARLALHALTGIRNYNTNNSQWEYELGSASLSLTRWTTSSVTETIQGYTINYTRYTYNGPDRGQMTIRLEF